MLFKDIPDDIIMKIGVLAYGYEKGITTSISIRYQPYIAAWYEDSREVWRVTFEGFFADDTTYKYRADICTNRDVSFYYIKDGIPHITQTSNQKKIQDLFNDIGYFFTS